MLGIDPPGVPLVLGAFAFAFRRSSGHRVSEDKPKLHSHPSAGNETKRAKNEYSSFHDRDTDPDRSDGVVVRRSKPTSAYKQSRHPGRPVDRQGEHDRQWQHPD